MKILVGSSVAIRSMHGQGLARSEQHRHSEASQCGFCIWQSRFSSWPWATQLVAGIISEHRNSGFLLSLLLQEQNKELYVSELSHQPFEESEKKS